MADVLDFNTAPRQLAVVTPADWDARLDALRTALRVNAADLVREIFPRARTQSGEARIGDVSGADGESLAINLHGERAGLWHDHATGEGGDLIELWLLTQNYGSTEFPKAVDDLERWLGLSSAPKFTSAVVSTARARQAAAERQAPVDHSLGAPVASWHYLSADGAVLAIVRRYDLDAVDPETGKRKKTFRPFTAAGRPGMPDPRPLYRLPSLNTASEVILVEGEKCADALASIGIEATTQMGGAKADPAKTDWSPLAGKMVLVWPDSDDAGAGLLDRVRPALEAIGCTVAAVTVPAGKPRTWDAADAVAEGEDIGAILATGRRPAPDKPKVPIYTRRQLREMKRPDWLVDEILVERSVITIYGPSGSLKSFVAIDLSMCVATGTPWHGRDVKQGAVVYVTGEGRNQIDGRYEAWERAHSYSGDAPILTVPMGIAISSPEWVGHLIEAIEASDHPRPAMIWLDTLARTFGAGDENSQKDMNAFVQGIDRLRDHFGCLVGVVHHTGKEETRGLRGSSALYAAMDTVIRTDRKPGRDMIVALKNAQPHGKQKDAGEFEDITFEARVVSLSAVDSKGRALTSLALQLAAAPAADMDPDQALPSQRRPQGANQIAVMDALKKAKGEPLGLTRLSLMVGKDASKVAQAVNPLVAKGLVLESGVEGSKRWTLA